jgi:predicted phage terminase large subunit-like protein
LQSLTEKLDLKIARQAELLLARDSLWEYCRTLSPDYYKEDRPHLKTLCETLQSFYQRKLLKDDGSYYTKLIIELPPQHGKSRTLTNFCSWILGHNQEERIITGSYNDDTAQDFSKYTRDIIQGESNTGEIVYSDIFPNTKIKRGDASYKQWALEGQFFNYKGCGINGTVTGKGASVRIIDDPVKSADVAYNINALDKIWLWYTGTWLSRRGESEVLDIICNTPWAKQDPTGRLLDLQPEKWYKITMPVIDKDGNMLCDSMLDNEAYEDIKSVADEHIHAANYLMQRLDIKGKLYKSFLEYSELPTNSAGQLISEGKYSYTDTADEGDDFLCHIAGIKSQGYMYVTDVIYTQDAQETTEPLTADCLIKNQTRVAYIESNNGGRGFARNVQTLVKSKSGITNVVWFHQGKNKISRILTNAPTVMSKVMFPVGWKEKWPGFYNALNTYMKTGKNKHDDAPDTITGLVEKTLISGSPTISANIKR